MVRGPNVFEIDLEAVASMGSARMSWLVSRGAEALTTLVCRRGRSPFHFQTTDPSGILVSVQTQPCVAFSPVCWSLFFTGSHSSPRSQLQPVFVVSFFFFLLRMHKKEHFSICDFSGAGRQAVPMGQMAVVQLSDRDPHTRPGRLHPCPTVWGSLSKGSDALPG